MSQRGVDMLKTFSEKHESDRESNEEWMNRKNREWFSSYSWQGEVEKEEVIEHGRD
jgi:hypothetical protein